MGFLGIVAATSFSYFYLTSGLGSKTMKVEPSDDRLERWQKRWSTGKTRWHKTEVHASLQQYLGEQVLDNFPAGGARILVPLCGKTVDMEYLARQRKVAEVVGVDGIRIAIEEFAKEHPDLEVQPVDDGGKNSSSGFGKWKGESITLLSGDFFDLDVTDVGGTVDAVWDRAAMVAIQPNLREQYVEKLGLLLSKPEGRIILSTYVRPNGDTKTGPPFSIDEAEVRRLFEGQTWVESVELLDVHSAASQESWYKAVFLYLRMGNVQEHIFSIKTK